MSIKLTLPYAPSINHAHWNTSSGKRVLKPQARAFFEEVAAIAQAARIEPISGDVSITMHIYRAATNHDISNRIKITEDALQGWAYENDKNVSELHIYKHEASKPKTKTARIEVEVKAA